MLHFFTTEQGNLLIRLLLAHIAADFIFQTKKMVENKSWVSSYMLLHVLAVFLLTLLFSGLWHIALLVMVLHWFTDAGKVALQKKYPGRDYLFFITDQLVHLLTILLVWAWKYSFFEKLYSATIWPFTDYKTSLLLLGYAIVIWPVGYLLKFVLQNMALSTDAQNMEHGGKLIGQFERIIILTFVLLGQYEAIGFLITGKSIIRFADKNSDMKSEYVLVGTMMSYAVSIIIGVCINWLLSLN